MDVQSISAIIFLVIVFIFLIVERKKVIMQKIAFPVLYLLMYKSQIGLRFMEKFARKYRRSLRIVAIIGIIAGFSGMGYMAYVLLKNVVAIFTVPEALPGVGIVLPFKVKGTFYVPFLYFIISIFILVVVHEFAHGIMLKLSNLRIKSSGFGFLAVLIPVLPLAFVEPDEEELRNANRFKQLSVFAAGSFANILLAFIVLLIVSIGLGPLSQSMVEESGVLVTGFTEGEAIPAQEAGVGVGEMIIELDGVDVRALDRFSAEIDKKKPGDSVALKTNKSDYNVTLTENPSDSEKAYLGVYIQQKTEIKQGFIDKYGNFAANAILWIIGLFIWLFVLNLGIGLFNLLPLGPLDGGRMLLVGLGKFMPQSKAEFVWKLISVIFLIVVLVNLFAGFLK